MRRHPTEDQIQRSVAEYLEVVSPRGKGPWIWFHVPNGGSRRGKAEGGRLRAHGVLAGVPDLLIIAPGLTLGLELKTKRGKLRDTQAAFRDQMRAMGHWSPWELVRSVDDVRAALRHHYLVDPRGAAQAPHTYATKPWSNVSQPTPGDQDAPAAGRNHKGRPGRRKP